MTDYKPADHILDEFLGKHGVRVTVGEFIEVLSELRAAHNAEFAAWVSEEIDGRASTVGDAIQLLRGMGGVS